MIPLVVAVLLFVLAIWAIRDYQPNTSLAESRMINMYDHCHIFFGNPSRTLPGSTNDVCQSCGAPFPDEAMLSGSVNESVVRGDDYKKELKEEKASGMKNDAVLKEENSKKLLKENELLSSTNDTVTDDNNTEENLEEQESSSLASGAMDEEEDHDCEKEMKEKESSNSASDSVPEDGNIESDLKDKEMRQNNENIFENLETLSRFLGNFVNVESSSESAAGDGDLQTLLTNIASLHSQLSKYVQEQNSKEAP